MAKQLKLYFDKETIELLGDKLLDVVKTFPATQFKRETLKAVQPLELKARVKEIGASVYKRLEGSYGDKVQILTNILGRENEGDFGTFTDFFWVWPISSIVEQYGLEYRKESLQLIYEITKRATGEFAVRQFIEDDPKHMLKVMNKWSKDKNFHVRRLSSEGLRPRLPWAPKLDVFINDFIPVIKILNKLKSDDSKYVVNSVANHMGDILKIDYEFGMKVLEEWTNDGNENTRWLIRHALRNLRKKKDERALQLTERNKK